MKRRGGEKNKRNVVNIFFNRNGLFLYFVFSSTRILFVGSDMSMYCMGMVEKTNPKTILGCFVAKLKIFVSPFVHT